MGGSSSPVKAIVKAVNDTVSTATKAIDDTAGAVDLEGNLDNVLGGTKDVIGGAGDVLSKGAFGLGKAVGDAGNIAGDVVGFVSGDKAERAANRASKEDAANRADAIRQQEQDASDLARQRSANRDASKGSSIILGGKKKKKKGSSVSSGLGLSKGDTGLQT